MPVRTYSLSKGLMVPTQPMNWEAYTFLAFKLTDGEIGLQLTSKFPRRDMTTGMCTSMFMGKPISYAMRNSEGLRSTVP